ncbi:CoA-transferase [Streptomyces sp. KLOTTS4A1]|uniref:CoA-transferase n=1 Tax=Streptomyces sp. KLOTTS4A1 TaxID=3390996 RepID=UPI0039F5D85C
MDKLVTASAAVSSIPSGSMLVLPDPGSGGYPASLVAALGSLPAAGFTVICPGLTHWDEELRGWLAGGQVERLIVDAELPDGRPKGVETEFLPPVLLRQRLQASAAGTPSFLGPVGGRARPAGEGGRRRAVREGARALFFGGETFAPVPALTPDVALLRAARADARGNLVFADAVREVALSAAKAARRTLAEADELLPVLHPRHVQLPARRVESVAEAEAEAALKMLG